MSSCSTGLKGLWPYHFLYDLAINIPCIIYCPHRGRWGVASPSRLYPVTDPSPCLVRYGRTRHLHIYLHLLKERKNNLFCIFCCRKSHRICPGSRQPMVMLVSPAPSWYVCASAFHCETHRGETIPKGIWNSFLYSTRWQHTDKS